MQYMLLCCINEDHWEGLDAHERDAVMQDYGAWMRKLDESGNHVLSARLQPSATAATIRGTSRNARIVDGPFAETKEQIGGFHLVNADSLEEALGFAEKIPTLRVGATVEVRALRAEPA